MATLSHLKRRNCFGGATVKTVNFIFPKKTALQRWRSRRLCKRDALVFGTAILGYLMRNWSEFERWFAARGISCSDTVQSAVHADRLLAKWFLRRMLWYRESDRDSVIGMRHRQFRQQGPNDSLVMLVDFLDVPGIVICVWDFDHYRKFSRSVSARVAGILEPFQPTARREPEPVQDHAVPARGVV